MLLEQLLVTDEVTSKLPFSVKNASRTGTLHNLLGNKLASEGAILPDGFTVEAALRELGRRVYYKNAQWSLVRRGLDALKDI